MSITVTNQVASQALRGQAVKVTLSGADVVSYLGDLELRELCTVDSTGETGTIISIDGKGNSFKVSPIEPDNTFSSGGGYLAAGETVIIGEVVVVDNFILSETGNFLITEDDNNIILE